MKKKTISISLYLFFVLFPLFFGGIIYLLFRSDILLMFKWIKYFGLNYWINFLKEYVGVYKPLLPNWFVYSLPDGLWVFSYTFLMILIWKDDKSRIRFFFIVFSFLLSIVLEFGQFLELIPGIFDFNDIIFIILGYLIPIYYEKKIVLKKFS